MAQRRRTAKIIYARIKLGAILADERAQPRVICEDLVAEYADDMRRRDKLPPPVVFQDIGNIFWLSDGFHRHRAVVALEWKTIECEVRQGGLRDAILCSCGANSVHGMRRTNEDKRRAVGKLLADGEWGKWSDREIARRCHVNHELVGELRQELAPLTGGSASERRAYRSKHGTATTMNTGNIGRGPKENERFADNDDDPAGSAKRHEAEAAAEQAITAELDRHAEEGERMTVTVESVMALIAQVRGTLGSDDEIRAFVAAIPQGRLEECADAAEWLTRLGGRLRLDLDRRVEINATAFKSPRWRR
jgi:hypothetical protein